MFDLELSRAIERDRRREIDTQLHHRRALREQAAAQRTDASRPGPRPTTGAHGPALGHSR